MEMLTVLFGISAVLSVGLFLWAKYTKAGRRWVEGDY